MNACLEIGKYEWDSYNTDYQFIIIGKHKPNEAGHARKLMEHRNLGQLDLLLDSWQSNPYFSYKEE